MKDLSLYFRRQHLLPSIPTHQWSEADLSVNMSEHRGNGTINPAFQADAGDTGPKLLKINKLNNDLEKRLTVNGNSAEKPGETVIDMTSQEKGHTVSDILKGQGQTTQDKPKTVEDITIAINNDHKHPYKKETKVDVSVLFSL